MSIFNDSVIRVPINKVATRVANQSGCTSSFLMSERDQLKAQMVIEQSRRKNSEKGTRDYIDSGKAIFELGHKLKDAKISDGIKSLPLSEFIIEVVKEKMSKHEWARVVSEATEMYESKYNK
jgi:hypothetical protein